jgi:hypothetical protein
MSARQLGTLGTVGLLLAAMPAWATNFSFGSVAATDDITSIQMAADDGAGGNTFKFDTTTNVLTITASVTQINFSNRLPITGIPIGDVIFSAQLDQNGAFSYVANIQTSGNFSNGILADFTIWDVAGGAVSVMEGDFIGGLVVTFLAQGGVIRGELTGEYQVNGGDADFQSAFGPQGDIEKLITTQFTGANLCNKIISCTLVTSGAPIDWRTFQTNATSTLTPLPEPSAALLLALAAAPLAALRRSR